MNPNDADIARRLSRLLGATVTGSDGRLIGHVNDVRLAPRASVRGIRAELVVEGLVISDRHAGSMLGYDRRSDQGPRVIRFVVRRLHRNARYLPWRAVRSVSWPDRRIIVDTAALEPLAVA
jgi:sporulation protein YlmC with PRC-barrel domain